MAEEEGMKGGAGEDIGEDGAQRRQNLQSIHSTDGVKEGCRAYCTLSINPSRLQMTVEELVNTVLQ